MAKKYPYLPIGYVEQLECSAQHAADLGNDIRKNPHLAGLMMSVFVTHLACDWFDDEGRDAYLIQLRAIIDEALKSKV
jgi:hypothetical protein